EVARLLQNGNPTSTAIATASTAKATSRRRGGRDGCCACRRDRGGATIPEAVFHRSALTRALPARRRSGPHRIHALAKARFQLGGRNSPGNEDDLRPAVVVGPRRESHRWMEDVMDAVNGNRGALPDQIKNPLDAQQVRPGFPPQGRKP